jgi:hypothetical protein
MAVAKKTPEKKTPVKTPIPNFEVGQKLVRKTDTPTIVGKTTKGEWILEEYAGNWGTEIKTYTSAGLAKEFKILS